MENHRYVTSKGIVFVMALVLLTPSFLYAYSDSTTHPALSSETVKFFNQHYPELRLSEDERHLVMLGSIDEDINTRPMQHFYDPVHDRGLTIGGVEWQKAPAWAKDTKAQASYNFNAFGNPLSAVQYGTNRELFSSDTDYSWERAVYDYAHSNKARGLRGLGHIIHLIQDMSVPDHTRNDPHPPTKEQKSPYESWTSRFDPDTIDVLSRVRGKQPVRFQELEQFFNSMAKYSNNNFFSKDTDSKNEYGKLEADQLVREEDGTIYAHVTDSNKNKYRLARVESNIENRNDLILKLDKDELILSDYWNLLSQQAVLHGAGVMKLFFEEVAKERETDRLARKNQNWFQQARAATSDAIFDLVGNIYGSSVTSDDLNELEGGGGTSGGNGGGQAPSAPAAEDIAPATSQQGTPQPQPQPQPPEPVEQAQQTEGAPAPEEEEDGTETNTVSYEEGGASDSEQAAEAQDGGVSNNGESGSDGEQPDSSPGVQVLGGGGGSTSPDPQPEEQPESPADDSGGDGGTATSTPDNENTATTTPDGGGTATTTPADTVPPSAPVLIEPDDIGEVFTDRLITFEGTAEASSTVALSYKRGASTVFATTTATPSWEFSDRRFGQGTTTIALTATDAAGNTSTTTSRTLFVDSEAPSVVLESGTCARASLATDGCLLATTTAQFSWHTAGAAAPTVFTINKNGAFSTTTATTTEVTINENSTYTFAVSATDEHGNRSATSSIAVQSDTSPVVINEIAWMGTEASFNDEWIELYNRTGSDIDLSQWLLRSKDNAPYLPLSGTIPAGGYYLIERTDDSTVRDIPADLVAPFSGPGGGQGLQNTGEALVLERVTAVGTSTATTTIDRVPQCHNDWCDGVNQEPTRRLTMERFDPHQPAGEPIIWKDAVYKFIKNGHDASGNAINGTPKARNGANHLVANGNTLRADRTLSADNSPYLIRGISLTIAENTTLTLQPGVVVKIIDGQDTDLRVRGNLVARGSAQEPVVFTAFADDAFGGDLNSDGSCQPNNASSTAQCPEHGAWGQIRIEPTSTSTELVHTRVHYGGSRGGSQIERGAIFIENTDAVLEDVVVSHAEEHGITMDESDSTLTRVSVQANNQTGSAAGVRLFGGAPEITDSVFKHNTFGIHIGAAPDARIVGNTASNNTKAAIFVGGVPPHLSGNDGAGNGENSIRFGRVTLTNGTTTLARNPLSYKVEEDMIVRASSTLLFEDGVVVKGEGSGSIEVEGGGALVHSGSAPSSVVFTSLFDDTLGSDMTAPTTSPEGGDWEGIRVGPGGTFDMSGFTLRYAGDQPQFASTDAALLFDGTRGTSTIANAVIERNKEDGIEAKQAGRVVLSGATVRDHADASAIGLHLNDTNATLRDTVFANNELDIRALGESIVTCVNCTATTTDPAGLLGP